MITPIHLTIILKIDIPPMGVANIEPTPKVNMTIPNDFAIICCPNISAKTTGIKPMYPPENKS